MLPREPGARAHARRAVAIAYGALVTVRTRPKRGDLVAVLSGDHEGRVGLVVRIDHRGIGDNRYLVRGHDDHHIGWLGPGQVTVVEYRPPKHAVVPLASPALDAVDRMLGLS